MTKKQASATKRHFEAMARKSPGADTAASRTFPIMLAGELYDGLDETRKHWAREFNRAVRKVETFLNEDFKAQSNASQTYMYQQIADQTGTHVDTVRRMFNGIGGSNGVTIDRASSDNG